MKSVKEILTEAAALGRKVGVAKGEFFTKDGSMCINGLIGAVINGEPLKNSLEYENMVLSAEFGRVVEVVAPIIGLKDAWPELADWNNMPSTSSEDVLSALEKAAASL